MKFLGLVNFGLGCNSTMPAVYANLQDPSIKDFIMKVQGQTINEYRKKPRRRAKS